MAKKNKTQDSAEVSTEAAETQSAKAELAELETAYKTKRKELRTVVREDGKSVIVDKGTELANELYEKLVKIAKDSGQKINRFTIRLGDDNIAVIKSAIVRLPKNEKAETVVEPDPEKQEAVKKTEADKTAEAATAKHIKAAAEKSGK